MSVGWVEVVVAKRVGDTDAVALELLLEALLPDDEYRRFSINPGFRILPYSSWEDLVLHVERGQVASSVQVLNWQGSEPMLAYNLLIQQLFPSPRRSVREEENLLVFKLLDILQRFERVSNLVSGMKQDAIAIEDEVIVLLHQGLQVGLSYRRRFRHISFGSVRSHRREQAAIACRR